MIWNFGLSRDKEIAGLKSICEAAKIEIPTKPWYVTKLNYIEWLSDLINDFIVKAWLKEHGITVSDAKW
jgi:hypothetical protein